MSEPTAEVEEDEERKRVRLFRAWSGIQACGRYVNPEWKPTSSAALVEMLMWWESLDEASGRLYGNYMEAMEAEGIVEIRNALRHARHLAVHQALLMNETVPKQDKDGIWLPIDSWIDLSDSEPDKKSLPGWKSYQAHLAGRPILPTVWALDRVFHAVFGSEPPVWLKADPPAVTRPARPR